MNFIGYKKIYGLYDRDEIYMHNVSGSVAGRTYDKSLLINDDSNQYESACIGIVHSICDKYFNKSISISKLKFIKMFDDNSGFISYVEIVEPEGNKLIVDNKNYEENLELEYKKQQRMILYILIFPNFLAIFFILLWVIHIYKSQKLV